VGVFFVINDTNLLVVVAACTMYVLVRYFFFICRANIFNGGSKYNTLASPRVVSVNNHFAVSNLCHCV
jgi:hypothetical protein